MVVRHAPIRQGIGMKFTKEQWVDACFWGLHALAFALALWPLLAI
jgi:hypothetical protein